MVGRVRMGLRSEEGRSLDLLRFWTIATDVPGRLVAGVGAVGLGGA